MMTRGQAEATATLIATLRPDWDHRGILAAIQTAAPRHTAPQIAIAAIHAATNPTNRTPAVIPLNGPHWNTGPTTGPADGPHDRRPCVICRAPHEPGPCPRRNPENAQRGAAAARALLRARQEWDRDHPQTTLADPHSPQQPQPGTSGPPTKQDAPKGHTGLQGEDE